MAALTVTYPEQVTPTVVPDERQEKVGKIKSTAKHGKRNAPLKLKTPEVDSERIRGYD